MDAGTVALLTATTRQRLFVLGLLAFFAILSVQYSFKVLGKEGGSAIVRWKNQIHEIVEGGNPYEGSPYPNPPIMVILLTPFALLPSLVGALAWFYLKVTLTLVAVFWVFRLVESPEYLFPPWAKAATVLLSLRPIMGDLVHGNVNLLILFLVVASLYAFRQRHDVASGIILALAIASKVTPVLLLPYFVWKRAWKTLLGAAVGLVLFFWIVPACVLGQQRNAEWLSTWAEKMIEPYVMRGEIFYSEHNNQSFPGLVLRLATHSPSFSTYVGDVYTPTQYHNLLSLDPRVAGWLIKGAMLGFGLIILWTCRTPTEPRENWRLSAEMGLILLGMLLFSERTWKHHCVTLVVPIAVICYSVAAGKHGRGMIAYLLGTLLAVEVLMASTSTMRLSEEWDQFAKLAQVYGAYVWAYCVLAAALVVLLRLPREQEGSRECLLPSSCR